MGKSQEVKDFLAGFTGGFKMMDDSFYKAALSDYYRKGGRKGGGSRYGLSGSGEDDKPNWLQRMFGAEEKKFDTPEAEGLANLQSLRQQAVREGNMGALKKIDQDIVDFGKVHGVTPGGSASAAGPVSRPPAAAPVAKPQALPTPEAKGDGGGQRDSNIRDAYGNRGGDDAVDAGTIKRHNSDVPPRTGILQRSSYETEGQDPEFQQASFSGDDAVDAGTAFAVEPEVSDWLAGGGLVGGARWPVEEENDNGMADMAIPEEGQPEKAPYEFGGAYDPSDSEYHEDEASVEVTEKMAQAAAPGIDAGLRRIQASFAPQAGLPDAEPAVANGAQAIARNEGAATAEEVAAIDRVIDPDGKLPPQARAAARIAAVWDFYSKTDPDKAADMAQRLMLHDKQNSQTRGALALQAIEQGNYGSAVKIIQDGFNNDIAGGGMIQKAVLRDDGNVNVTARTDEGTKTFTAPKEMIHQVASEMANGKAYFQQTVTNSAKALEATRKPKAQSGIQVDEDAAREYMTAKIRLRQAMNSNDSSAIAKAQQDLAIAESNAVEYAVKQRNPEKTLRAMGINPNAPLPKPQAPPRAAPAPKAPNLTAEERSQLADQTTRQRYATALEDTDELEKAGVRVGSNGSALPVDATRRVSEGTRIEEARRTIEPHRQQIEREAGGYAYKKAKDVQNVGSYDEVAGSESTLEEAAKNLNKDGRPLLTDNGRRDAIVRQAYRLARKNDVAPGQIIEFLYNAQNDPTTPMRFDRATGRLQVGNNKLLVDDDTLTDIAQARGALRAKLTNDENNRMRGEAEGALAISSELEKAKRDLRQAQDDLANYNPSKPRSALGEVSTIMSRASIERRRDAAEAKINELRNKPVKGFSTAKERRDFAAQTERENLLREKRRQDAQKPIEVLE